MTGADQGYDGSLVPGEAPAIPAQFDREYVVPVSFGGQTLRMDLDTGSSDLEHVVGCSWRILKLYEIATHNDILPSWVFSTLLSAASQIGHYVYDKTKSSTFKDLPGLTFQIIYGDGSSASGVVGTETVNVGGIAVKDQSIELATVVSGGFVQDTNSDGLLGMGFNTINQVKPVKQKTFLDNALPQLALPVFTADLKHSLPGTYDFGFIDPKKHKGNITFVPIVGSVGFWSFNVTGHGVGNSFNAQPSLGVADTGTTLLLLESAVVASYYAAVPGSAFDANQGGFTFPCKTQLPSFTVGIGSHKAVISGSLMNFVPIASTGSMSPPPLSHPVRLGRTVG
ncbi:hypothetical protein FGG08_003600 [Glutinoglossum americanum]|uniref:Peptidase A1 domain-containing protein n=1 Tax=Glutinoglossum americanum TaxID=1670608 RepID=A0A9P8IAS0_9PEZI|nr:hypothetical protein FGG08_003600 [Glutinoglossum americanum]